MTTRRAKFLRVERTIADLEATAGIEVAHATEAINLVRLVHRANSQ